PVVLVHGIGRSLEDWQDAQDRLATTFRVVNLDLPGFGLTPRLRAKPGLPTFARAVVGVLDALGEHRPVHLMGNSLGGAVAMTVATTAPDRVASLVLVNSAGFGREANLPLRPMLYRVLSALPVLGARFRPLARDAGLRLTEALFADPAFATPERVRHAAKVGRQPDFRATFVGTLLSLGLPVAGSRPGWRRALLAAVARAGKPVLVVWGDRDTVLPVKHFHAAVATLPGVRGHLFPATGHMPQIERVDEFTALAADFVGGVAVP
ncbi:MAG: alpha/beta fold hydrolase, partial [Saccharothrix sp.]|nr:alpha/beta fold hydrolase [Saccharothrix sp.]